MYFYARPGSDTNIMDEVQFKKFQQQAPEVKIRDTDKKLNDTDTSAYDWQPIIAEIGAIFQERSETFMKKTVGNCFIFNMNWSEFASVLYYTAHFRRLYQVVQMMMKGFQNKDGVGVVHSNMALKKC